MKTWIIASDIHIPKENKPALDCFFQTLKKVNPDGIILNGDILDCGVFSRHDIFSPPKCHWTDSQFLIESQNDYTRALKFFDKIQLLSPKAAKVYNLGNHEIWVYDFINKSYKIRHKNFDLDERLLLTKRGWKVNDYKKIYKLGKLRVVHTLFDSRSGGGSGGKYHSAKHVDTMGASVIYGHYHDIQSSSKVTPERNSHMGWCTGCLCDLNPEYIRNGPQNWSHGFAIVYMLSNGNFQVDVKRITDGKLVVHGECLDGNKGVFWK